MRKRKNNSVLDVGNGDRGMTRRHFISTIFSFSLFGLARPALGSDRFYIESGRTEYMFVNGWIIRYDDYEKLKDV